jgi:putative PEP-CTERM system histidine kinase
MVSSILCKKMNFSSILSISAIIATLSVIFIVLWRDPNSFTHRVLALGLALLAIETGLIGFAPLNGSWGKIIFWQWIRFLSASFLPGLWVLFSLTYARSNFREILWKRLWLVMAAFILPVLLVLAFRAHFFTSEPVLTGTDGLALRLGWSGYLFELLFLLFSVFILMNLERTLRISAGRVRWQIKFVVIGVGSLFAARIYLSSQALLFRSIDVSTLFFTVAVLLIMDACIMRALWRSRGLDADFYVSTTFLYNSLTIVIVGLYLIGVSIIARLSFYFGVTGGATYTFFYVFLAFLGLVVLLLSDRLRRRLKRSLVRHLKRPYHDYRKEWASFTEKTANVADIVDLCSIVARIVSRTFDTLSVTIWLSDEAGERVIMAGSTVFAEGKFQDLTEAERFVLQLLNHANSDDPPIDYNYRNSAWSKEEGIPDQFFEETRIQHVIPLVAAGKMVGAMTIGDRVGRDDLFFTVEDFDLLKTMADQAAANLYNLMLAERLRKAKEMEAFQAMSAFFIHDLKNVASKISLTMQNLPVHFDNPEFRADALKSFSQSLNKINGMCTRLSALSQKLELKKAEADLNQIISSVMAEMKTATGAEMIFEPGILPRVIIDAEQFQKVLVNLLLNAKEATTDGGFIRVGTSSRNKWIECAVTDNGCGMSREFMKTSLFRPFQTTKSRGMGIGLYHSKSIIEAHNGKIEVESVKEKGTIFRVMLPAPKER